MRSWRRGTSLRRVSLLVPGNQKLQKLHQFLDREAANVLSIERIESLGVEHRCRVIDALEREPLHQLGWGEHLLLGPR